MKRYYAPIFMIGTSEEKAGISTARLTAGSRFHETDTGGMYVWNGTVWQMSTGGDGDGGGGLSPTETMMRISLGF